MQFNDEVVPFSDEETAALERVRQQQGLACVVQAAQWLALARMRKQVKQLTGRGPAMYLVHGSKS